MTRDYPDFFLYVEGGGGGVEQKMNGWYPRAGSGSMNGFPLFVYSLREILF